jgi:hypothetical protein
MQAAERIFEGKFDDIVDSDMPLENETNGTLDTSEGNKSSRMVVSICATPIQCMHNTDNFRHRRTKMKILKWMMMKAVSPTICWISAQK